MFEATYSRTSFTIDLDQLQDQAERVSKHFLYMYGTQIWNIEDPVAIQLADELQRDMKSYFVCLLQIPLGVPENKLLLDTIKPELKTESHEAIDEDKTREAGESSVAEKENQANTCESAGGEAKDHQRPSGDRTFTPDIEGTDRETPAPSEYPASKQITTAFNSGTLEGKHQQQTAQVDEMSKALDQLMVGEYPQVSDFQKDPVSLKRSVDDFIWDGGVSPEQTPEKSTDCPICGTFFATAFDVADHVARDHPEV